MLVPGTLWYLMLTFTQPIHFYWTLETVKRCPKLPKKSHQYYRDHKIVSIHVTKIWLQLAEFKIISPMTCKPGQTH